MLRKLMASAGWVVCFFVVRPVIGLVSVIHSTFVCQQTQNERGRG